jgi:hypothetical protein
MNQRYGLDTYENESGRGLIRTLPMFQIDFPYVLLVIIQPREAWRAKMMFRQSIMPIFPKSSRRIYLE